MIFFVRIQLPKSLTQRSDKQILTCLPLYRLVDLSGKQVKDTTAAKVLLNSPADVDDFLNAVLKIYNDKESTILTGIASSQLIVYRNEKAFDDDKEEPLEVDSSIVGLRGIKIKMLSL
jgi:hypothetical protein